jgi:HlyD family type I secretion membrane fusion protein
VTVFALVVILGGWGLIAPLASAALAPGVVSPDGSRKTIQHLEGGIIQSINVKEGDHVKAGQSLIVLDNTQANAHFRELRERLIHLLATEARLKAELKGEQEVTFPEELLSMADASAKVAMIGHQDLLLSKKASLDGRAAILAKRIDQLEEEIKGFEQVIEAESVQISLIRKEIKGVKILYDKGLVPQPRLLALQRSKAVIDASQATSRANIASSKQKIGETQIQLLTLSDEMEEKANEELAQVRAALGELRNKLSSREDILSRTEIVAPISGTVMDVRVTTEGGVIAPGDPVLDIVPEKVKLIIDAQLDPKDIENVRPGMKAQIILTAYSQRNLPRIFGTLRSVSADRIVEKQTGRAYYLAKIEVDEEDLARIPEVRLIPGMPADVMILNSERTFFDYIFAPLMDSLERSFLES